MHVLVTGDRNWINYPRILNVLATLPLGTYVVHGYADGADTLAHAASLKLGHIPLKNPAHWRHNDEKWAEVYGRCPEGCKEVVGRPAGVIRNGAMLAKYPQIELVLAFHNDLGNSRGTKDMVARAIKKNIKTALFTDTDQVLYPF